MGLANKTIEEIQALRAIAVLLVVFYHGDMSWFSGGYVGVDVFFVVSGYLITGLLVREHARVGRISLSKFYARRILRLLPAATLTVSTVCIVGWFTYSPLEFKQLTSSAIASSMYLSNLWFFQMSTDYLAAQPHSNPLLHTWSLSVEEQFYLFWPLLIIALTKSCQPSQIFGRLVLGLAVVSIVSIILCVVYTMDNQPLAFFGPHARAWEFGAGGVLALFQARGLESSPKHRAIFQIIGLLLVFGSSFTYSDSTAFPGTAAIWPVLGAVLFLHSCSGGKTTSNAWMKFKPIQYIGDISYSLYLWHWPVVIVLQLLYDKLDIFWILVYLGSSLLLASFSYHCVENPVRFSKFLTSSPTKPYYFGIGLSVLVICSIGVGRMASVEELGTAKQAVYRDALNDIAQIYNDGCHLSKHPTAISEECVYGPSDAEKKIVLFGDSHAANWFPALRELAFEQGFKLYSLTKSSCPSFHHEPFNSILKRQYTECTQWRVNALRFISESPIDLVILANSDGAFVSDNGYGGRQIEIAKLTRAIGHTKDWLERTGVPFLVIRDIPRIDFDPVSCLSRAAWKGEDSAVVCAFQGEDEANGVTYDLLNRTFAGVDNGVLLDMNDQICPAGGNCMLERDGLILYRDSHHITASFSRYLSTSLLQELRDLGLM